jgi:hypothetical protein
MNEKVYTRFGLQTQYSISSNDVHVQDNKEEKNNSAVLNLW